MTDPTTIALAREVLATERTRYHGQPERTDEALARALLEAQEALAAATRERDHWKANHDEAIARQRILTDRPDLPLERVRAAEALRTAQRGRDEALAVLGECRGVLAGTPDSADESGNVRALLSRIDALTAKGEGR